MNKYELLYIIACDVTEEKREQLIAKFKSLIEEKGGEIAGIDKWGMRKFAYPINFKNEGFYVLVNFSAKPEIIDGISKLMNITDGIVRHMFVKKEDYGVKDEQGYIDWKSYKRPRTFNNQQRNFCLQIYFGCSTQIHKRRRRKRN